MIQRSVFKNLRVDLVGGWKRLESSGTSDKSTGRLDGRVWPDSLTVAGTIGIQRFPGHVIPPGLIA